jgi:hypothetical protein
MRAAPGAGSSIRPVLPALPCARTAIALLRELDEASTCIALYHENKITVTATVTASSFYHYLACCPQFPYIFDNKSIISHS